MRFDFTHGNAMNYTVSVYGWNVEDKMLFSDYGKAFECFKREIASPHSVGVSITLWDANNGVRKAVKRF